MKRFIAGAICPECHREDTLYVLKAGDQVSRHCVKCGFSENRPDTEPRPLAGQWSPVRLSDKDRT